jgi:DNA-binding NtrC family response regulator
MTGQVRSPQSVLVVEDEYLIAAALAQTIEDAGMEVIGPASSVKQALQLIAEFGNKIEVATLDVNLRGTLVFPVADALRTMGVPFVFCSGYDLRKFPDAYKELPRFEKPVDSERLLEALLQYGEVDERQEEGESCRTSESSLDPTAMGRDQSLCGEVKDL